MLAESFPPIFAPDARLLILGSMPGVKSLEARQYYAHPRNAFWPIMGELFGCGPELPYDERCRRLQAAGVAVWDVLRRCEREGSLDTSIDRASEVANDFGELLAAAPRIKRVFFNGGTADAAFRRHVRTALDPATLERLTFARLPSTSPAHAARSFEEKLAVWRIAVREASGDA